MTEFNDPHTLVPGTAGQRIQFNPEWLGGGMQNKQARVHQSARTN